VIETYINPTALFVVLRGRAERHRSKWIKPPKLPESIEALNRAVERILSCGNLRTLDRMGDVVQPGELLARKDRRPPNPDGKQQAVEGLHADVCITDERHGEVEPEVRTPGPRDEHRERPHDFTDIHGPRPRTPVPFPGNYN